jgi:hypothetical protein
MKTGRVPHITACMDKAACCLPFTETVARIYNYNYSYNCNG